MESIILNVRPQVLIAKAGELNSEKGNVSAIMDEAKAKMASLTGTWRSAASDEYQLRFRQTYEDIDGMLAVVAEYVHDLNEAANLYTSAENAARTAAQGLPTGGVFR